MANKKKIKQVHRNLNKTNILFLVLVILVGLVIHSVFSDWQQIFENKKLKEELTIKYENLKDNEEKLSSEVIKLQDPEYMQRYAREKYGYSKDGELILRVDYAENE